MKEKTIDLNGKAATGYEIAMKNAALVFAVASNGFVMCGYLNMETAEKLGDAACIVRGVKTVDDLLKAKVVAITSQAKQFGVEMGMTGKEALDKLA